MPLKKQYPCLVCDKDVGGKTGSVQCNFCDKWVHPACGGISKPHLDILIENPSTTWTCKPCFGVSSKIKKEVQVLALKQEQSRKEIQANKEEIERVKVRMDIVEKKVEEIDKDAIIKISNEAVFREIRERESRKSNLVLHKVPELVGDSVTSRDRRDHDIRKVLEIFEFLQCTVPAEDIKFIYRPGDKVNPEWPRPVILSLKDPGARHYILAHSNKLANSNFNQISIVPDLTPQQRNEEEGLRKEATKLNAELTEEEAGNWEWVCVGLRGQKRLIKRRIVEGRGRGRPSAHTQRLAVQRPEPVTETRTARVDRGASGTSSRGSSRGRGTTSSRTSTTRTTIPQVSNNPRNQDKGEPEPVEKEMRGEKEKGTTRKTTVSATEEEENHEVVHVEEGEEEEEESNNQDTDVEDMDGGVEEGGGGKKRGRETSTSPSLPNNKKASTNQKQ